VLRVLSLLEILCGSMGCGAIDRMTEMYFHRSRWLALWKRIEGWSIMQDQAKRTLLSTMLMTLILTGCAGGPLTTREQFTYGGGVLGASTGAIIGAASGSAAAGVAIGGPVGAVAGYLIGESLQGGRVVPKKVEVQKLPYRVSGYSRKFKPQEENMATTSAESGKSSGRAAEDSEGGRIF
jgi:osmotically inducible lipoprotein OsmB